MSSGRILVVEDEVIVAKDIADSLERLGYTVIGTTATGEEALRLAAEHHPDLALMDIRLQGQLNGIETAERLRDEFNIPSVFLTAYADDDTLRRARITEPYGYVLKPFELRELHSTIEIALYKHGSEKKLRESEHRYRTLQRNLPVGVFRVTPVGEIISVNPALVRIFGAESESQMLKMRVEQLYRSPNQRPFNLQQILADGGSTDLEMEIKRLDGAVRQVQINVTAVTDASGKPQYYDGMILDITERKLAETALRESERKLSTLMGNLPGMVYRCLNDENWTMEFISEGCRALTGYGRDELIGNLVQSYSNVIHPDDRGMVWDYVQRELKQGQPFRLEYRIRTSDGEEKWVWEQGMGIFSDDGELVALEGFITDVTKRVRAEEALRTSEENYRSFVQNFQGIAYRAKMDYTPFFFHGAVEEITGYTEAEFVSGTPRWDDVIYPEDRNRLRDSFENIQTIPKYSTEREYRIVRKDGELRWVNDIIQNICDDDGKPFLVQGVLYDITERKQADEEHARTQALLTAAVEQSPAGILIADAPDVRIRVANSAALGIRGKTDETLTNIPVDHHPQSWQTRYPDGSLYRPEDLPLSRAVLEGVTSQNVEVIIRRSDGEDRWVLANASPVRNDSGEVIAGLVVFADITERRRAEQALRASETRLAQIVQGSSVASFVVDRDHKITHWNKALESLTGYGAADMIGTYNQWMAFYKKRRPILADMIIDGMSEIEIASCYQGMCRRHSLIEGFELESFFSEVGDGGRWLYVMAAPLTDEAGEILGAIETIQDVSLRKQAEAELQKKHQALEEKNIALRAVLHHLEDEKRDFKVGIAQKIDQVLMPAMQRLVGSDGKVVDSQYDMIVDGLRGLVLASGGILHLYSKLSRRETEICNLIRSGSSSPQISKRLGITLGTVKKHRETIRGKFGISNKDIKLAEFLRNM